MPHKNLILYGLVLAVILFIVATLYYPGGTYDNEQSQGYDWANNYISNLLQPRAVNGMPNTSRPWAVASVLFMSVSFALFFVEFSKRIQAKNIANIIKYLGVSGTIIAFFTVIPSLHDIMVTISSICTLVVFFYITVLAFKSKLFWLKICSVCFLFLFYLATYMYFTGTFLVYMPIMQKTIHLAQIFWVLSLTFFTKTDDFEHIKA